MSDSDPLYINTLLKVATEQRDAALNDVCRLTGEKALLAREVDDLKKRIEAAKKPRAKPKPKRPRPKR